MGFGLVFAISAQALPDNGHGIQAQHLNPFWPAPSCPDQMLPTDDISVGSRPLNAIGDGGRAVNKKVGFFD